MAFITRRVVKGPEGRPHIAWVDTKTGETIPHSEIGNHTIIEQGKGLGDIWSSSKTKKDSDTSVEETEEQIYVPQQGNDDYESAVDWSGRTEDNDFGYMQKNPLLSWLGVVPGIVGTTAKAAGAFVNINNTAAVSAARSFLDLPDLSLSETLKGIATDTKGYIGDVVIGGEQVPIGLGGGKTPEGRVMTDPSAARAFIDAAKDAGVEVRSATPDEVKSAEQESRAATHAEVDFSSPSDLTKSLGRTIGETLTGKELTPVSEQPNMVDAFNDARVLSPVDTATPAAQVGTQGTVPGRSITPGAGLANLAPNGLRGLPEVNKNFGPLTVGPSQEHLVHAVQLAVANHFGPGYSVMQTSGARTNSQNHMDGKAMDFAVIDPNGTRVTDRDTLAGFASELGRQGIQSLGYGKGYMGPGMMHAGIAPSAAGATSWGAGGRSKNADPVVKAAFDAERGPVGILPMEAPAPESRPINDVNEVTLTSFAQEPQQTAAQTAIQNVLQEPVSSRNIPSNILNEMATTIAGELGSKTIQAIRSDDPEAKITAMKEVADIASTMYNRSQSTGNWNAVTDSSQYNSRMKSNMATTMDNLSLVGGFIKQALNDYNKGSLIGNAPNATHYRASYVNPSWANHSKNEIQSGEHIFSNVTQPGTGILEYGRKVPDIGPVPDSRPTTSWDNQFTSDSSYDDSTSMGSSYGDYGGASQGGGWADSSGNATSGGVGSGGYNSGDSGYGVDIGGVGIVNDDGSIDWGGTDSGSGWGNSSTGWAASAANSTTTTSGGSGWGAGSHHTGGADAFGQSYGAGGGHQGNAGISGTGTGYGPDAQSIGGSFAGFNAGSLGGSASGWGSGYGSAGSGFSSSIDSQGQGYGAGLGGQSSGYTTDGGASYSSGDSGDSDSGTVLCGYYYSRGMIPRKVYVGDLRYSMTVNTRTRQGYLLWATPLVNLLEKYGPFKAVDFFLYPIVRGWAYEMAYHAGYSDKRSRVGRYFSKPLAAMSYIIGFVKEKI